MTESEIMQCAAILASGIIANGKGYGRVLPNEAVDLMEQIAAVMADRRKDTQQENEEWL